MSDKDQIQRFMFDQLGVRGQLVGLNSSYQEAITNHDYPTSVQRLLGEFMSAAALLSTTIKFEGTLSLQAQGDGDLNLIMAECRHDQEVRGVARWESDQPPSNSDFKTLLGNGRMAVTITPDKGQRYQGIIPLEGNSLAACLEDYFQQSEQLPTRVWLATEPGYTASGMLIQVLPQAQDAVEDIDGWDRISKLTETLSNEELLSLPNETILHRLYHEEMVRVFPATNIQFKCTCSAYRTLQAIVSMGAEQVEEVFNEQPQVTVRCEFCNTAYEITQNDIHEYLQDQSGTENHTLH